MSTKIILTVEGGLSRQEMDDLRYLLSDAVTEFATRRTTPEGYVERRYTKDVFHGDQRTKKIEQVRRRVALASKLHPATTTLDYEHVLPHEPMPIMDYYKNCDEADLPAMSAALDFLPAAQFGERKGWIVLRENGILVIHGPDEQFAFWADIAERWMWREDRAAQEASK